MQNDFIEIEREIKTLVVCEKEQIEDICRNYHAKLLEAQGAEDRVVSSCEELRRWAKAQYERIKDPVFKKQAQMLQTKKFQTTTANIDDACKRYLDDVECILKSKVPLWLSSICYAFSHNWRKRVYEDIIENYIYIEQYIAQEIRRANEATVNTINNYNTQSKNALKKINQALISNISDIVYQKNSV